MITATLIRTETSAQGTFGLIDVAGLRIHTAEPPWRDNAQGESCIPAGEYEVEPWSSRRFPGTYHVEGVPERSAILIHTGNVAGDRAKGLHSHTLGCILPGLMRGVIANQKAVLLSGPAMNQLRNAVGGDRFRLRIQGEGPWNG